MADFVKRKIVEKLAKFTKDLKPSDISFKFLSGKGELHNLELNALFITEVLQLPPWIQVTRVVCDTIRGHVPFTSLRTEPVKFSIGKVTIEVATCADEGPRKSHADLLKKISGGKPSKYGFTEKVIDGMEIEIGSILVQFQDPTFHARLEMTSIRIMSTTPDWKTAPTLNHTRYKIADEDSIVNFKMVRWGTLKLEGWGTSSNISQTSMPHSKICLMCGDSKIKVLFKRNLANSKILATKISVFLGDILWIITQSQLRAVSKLIQSLMQAAVQTAKLARLEREKHDSDQESVDSMESVTSTASSEVSIGRHGEKGSDSKNSTKHTPKRSLSSKDKHIKQKRSDYYEGKQEVPYFDVIQDSFHIESGRIDLQLCDDTENSHIAQGSMLIELQQLLVDLYFEQGAGVGRAHWNHANDIIMQNTKWSKKLIQQASKTQFMDYPSIDLVKLKERSILVRCSDFSISALKSGSSTEALPIVTCDKKTFCIPDDIYNPAFQVGVTLYHYPPEHIETFSAPRPNIFIYLSPLHVNVDQRSCIWLVEFAYGVVKTINMELAISAHDEGKSYIESKRTESIESHTLPGFDASIKILFTKVTVPLPEEVVVEVEDGRPKALQVETGAISIKNSTLESLLMKEPFQNAIQGIKAGWVFDTQDTDQFPHFTDDVQSLPTQLREIIESFDSTIGRSHSVSSSDQRLFESERKKKLDLAVMEGWHIQTECVHVSFAESYTHQATLYTTKFVDDFPVHLFLFPPQSDKDTSISSAPSTPSSSPAPQSIDPFFSFIAHAPDLIRAELNRTQVLFLMRLKDSIVMFKNRLMAFLDTSSFMPPSRVSSPEHEDPGVSVPPEKPKALSGCVIVEHVQANILLPSIFTTNNTTIVQSPNTPATHNDKDAPSQTTNIEIIEPGSDNNLTDGLSESPVGSKHEGNSHLLDPPENTQTEQQFVGDSLSAVQPNSNQPSPAASVNSLSVNVSYSPVMSDISEDSALLTDENTDRRHFGSADNLAEARTVGLGAKSFSSSSLPVRSVSVPIQEVPSSLPSELYPSKHLTVTLHGSPASIIEDEFVMVESPNTKVEFELKPLIEDTETETVNLKSPSESAPTVQTKKRLKSPPPISERKVRSLTPPKSEPEYIMCINVDGVHALPNILTSGSIVARVNANTIDIREIKKDKYKQYKEDSMFKRTPYKERIVEKVLYPVVKARIEIGDQAARFFPGPELEADAILIIKATGLDIALLTQNMAVLKDFFDDEFETDSPIPVHVRVDNTRLVILKEPGDGVDNWKTLSVEVNQADIHRGKCLREGANVFMDGGQRSETPVDRISSISEIGRSSAEPSESYSREIQESNSELLASLKSFITNFDTHLKLHGHASSKPDHIASILAELHRSILGSKTDSKDTEPPPYSEAMSVMVTSHLQFGPDSNSELIRLRRENEELRQLQLDRERLNAKLVESQNKLEQSVLEMDHITGECKKAKEELVAYKQVLENQHDKFSKLLEDNHEMRRKLGWV